MVRRVIAAAGRLLRPGGTLVVEVGGDQDELLGPVWGHHGFDPEVQALRDDDGDLRAVVARRLTRPP